MGFSYLFGPVPSRRLGVSLGIDLVPLKTCSYNCVYCECGKTTELTTGRKEYFPTEDIIRELDEYLVTGPDLDFITFAGSGEPTLHTGIGEIARHIREHYPAYRMALLTNGSLFFDPQVRREVADIHVVIPSLDAVSEQVFRRIDRPCRELSVDAIIDGLVALKQEHPGEVWLEIFVVPGVNDTDGELALFADVIRRIGPDLVQLNGLDRPGIAAWVHAPTEAEMTRFRDRIGYPATEIVRSPTTRTDIPSFSQDTLESILLIIRRRPSTVEDLSKTCGLHPNEIRKYTDALAAKGLIAERFEERGVFFVAV
ncbi:radical SAM protein [Methanomicrobiaceae archaeon CYW5]|uniref:radical SAM protein n=1 Tax=Methanovulcanius yangii TaxID=1789227 RepID=UPI0029CA7C90|nr:radical SAM protein [Methanovulcanius yangii]MBT8508321.1 radical SAM protein [Methanovulcanius yangii]